MALPGTSLGGPVWSTILKLGPGPRGPPPHTMSSAPGTPSGKDCELTGGRPGHRHQDGLRQRVQVGPVATQTVTAATASASTPLILRHTLWGGEGRDQDLRAPRSRGWSPGLPRDLSILHSLQPLNVQPLGGR